MIAIIRHHTYYKLFCSAKNYNTFDLYKVTTLQKYKTANSITRVPTTLLCTQMTYKPIRKLQVYLA